MRNKDSRSQGLALLDATNLTLAGRRFRGAVGFLTLAIAGCSGMGTGASLEVVVDAPDSVKPEIVVNGPGKFYETIHGTTRWDDVPTGSYSIRVVDRRARVAGRRVDQVVSADRIDGAVTVSEQTSSQIRVRYTRELASGHLWIPVPADDRVVAVNEDALEAGRAGDIQVSTGAGTAPSAVAVDPRGNLWVSLTGAGTVARYAPADLGASGAPAPTLTVRGLSTPQGVAFDGSGDLFVAEGDGKRLSRYGVTDAAATKKAVIPVAGTPRALAFDKDGALYVTTIDPAAVVVFDPATLSSVTPVPKATLRGAATGLVAPAGLAFSADGNLWVTNGDGGALQFAGAAAAGATGEVALVPVASVNVGGVGFYGLAFDNTGEAWLGSIRDRNLGIARAREMQSGAPIVGDVTPIGGHSAPAPRFRMAAFDPPPRTLPLRR